MRCVLRHVFCFPDKLCVLRRVFPGSVFCVPDKLCRASNTTLQFEHFPLIVLPAVPECSQVNHFAVMGEVVKWALLHSSFQLCLGNVG